MTDLNNLTIMGRLTKSPDQRRTGDNNTLVLSFTIANNRGKKNSQTGVWEDETSFIDVNYFTTPSNGIIPYLDKGTNIAITGYIKQQKWESNGEKRSRLIVVAQNIYLTGKNNSTGIETHYSTNLNPNNGKFANQNQNQNETFYEDTMGIDDNSLPF